MLRIAPHRYQSASGALQELGRSLETLGERALIIASRTALERFEDVVRESLKKSMIGVSFEIHLGECCLPEVERLADEAEKEDADIIVGIGGGKTLDVAKYTAETEDYRTVAVPSVASSPAAFNNRVDLYNEDGKFLEVKKLESAPDLTLVDYKIVGRAPSRHLRAGMGVALAASYDFEVSRGELEFHQPSRISFELADHVRESLLDTGETALEDVKKGEVSSRVEAVVEMNILEAGLITSLGRETSRTMIAHQMARHLHPYTAEGILYGEVVSFGVLVQQLFRGRKPKNLADLLDFYRRIELPLSLDSLGLPENQRESILKDALESILAHLEDRDLTFEVSRGHLRDATEKADDLGQRVIQSGVKAI